MKTKNIIKFFTGIVIVFFLLVSSVYSEGTKEIRPTSADNGYVQLDPAWGPFALYGCPVTSRLHIRICNVGEKIFYGFRQANGDVRFRIKDPNGNIVVAQTTVPTSGAGFISTYAEAVNGPAGVVGVVGGYTPRVYTTTMTGDYYIEFLLPSGNPRRDFEYFDITVASAANVRINGRVWSQSWQFSTRSYNNSFEGVLFIYADDGIVTSIDFNGMQPYSFILNANITGTANTGNPASDRRSKVGNSTYPQYKVFLNDPDPNCFPTGQFGTITAPTTITGCPPNLCINVFVDRPGSAEVLLDLNGVPGFQAGTADRILSQDVLPPTTCIVWDGKDGLGNLVTSSTNLTTRVEFYNGLTHIPIYDVERNPNGFIVNLVRPPGPSPKLYYDDSLIPIAGGASELGGCNAPCHIWNWTCCANNPATDYGNNNTINTWWYADSTVSISNNTVPPAVSVNADTRIPPGIIPKDTTICASVNIYTLSGAVQGAPGGVWSTSGTGTFSNTSDLNSTYTFSPADKAAGSVTLTLTSSGGTCPIVSDNLIIRFQNPPTANSGGNTTVCANNPSTLLNGSITNAGGAVWTSTGAGTFSPSATTLNATYTPSSSEISGGSAVLTLTTTGNGKCPPVSAEKTITIQASPVANAGPNQNICSNNPNVTLAGTVSNATGQTWSGGAGTFSPDANTLNAVYTPTAAEISSGTLVLTLTADRAGCNPVSSNMTITFQAPPAVNAGNDQSVCYNNPNVNLNGSVINAASQVWSGGSGTFSPNNSALNAVYTPTTAELNSGSFTLTLTATRAGCNPVNDDIIITVTPAPASNAGPNGVACANNAVSNVSGSVAGAGGGVWTTTGCGTFIPNATTLNASYVACPSDVALGAVNLILTTTGNNNCSPVSDTALIVYTPAPVANAGPDRNICSNNPAITLAGSVIAATSSIWSGGSGFFAPNPAALNAVYTPTPAEISAGSVTLTLTASRATCNPVTDQVIFTFTPPPVANAGADQSVCHNNSTVSLNGSVTVATGGTWSGGGGTFTPNANTLNAQYTPTLAERNSGSVTLTLTTTGNGNCNAVSDQMTVTVTPAPAVDAGADQSVCANNATVSLNGSVSLATGGTWTGGGGAFAPNANALNAAYTPSAAEITAGNVTLTLTTTGNGNCNPVTDQISISITPAPAANAGADQTICAANPAVNLNGSVTVAGGGVWTGGAGTFNPGNNALNASYTPTVAEINTGTVSLTLTTTGNGNCNPVSDQMNIYISPAPLVDAGPDQTVCAATNNVSLNGIIINAGGGQWISTGTGSFSPNATTLNAVYVASEADKSAGNVTLTLTSTGNGVCNPASDHMTISFTPVPTANAGPDQIVCANDLPIQLNASGSSGNWSGGSGTFTPGSSTFNAIYTPSAAEISAGSVTLTFTTIPSGACPSVSDQVTITIPPAPLANAGGNQSMCGNATSIPLNGTITNAGGGFWTSSGTGSFSPNASALNASYVPSASDKTNGSVLLTLSTVANGACTGHSNQITLTIQPAISLNTGPDQIVCADLNQYTLTAAFITGAGGGIWSTSGTGTFSPNNTTINAIYNPSAADKASGAVILTLSSTGNGICPALSDDVVYTITPAPAANAGADQSMCADASSVTLNGAVTIAAGGQWSSSGSGTFTPDNSTLNGSYVPSNADKAAGNVTLTLTTTGNGTCNAVTDQMILTITPAPVVNAGPDQTVCADIASVQLAGSVSSATGGTWSTNGDGTFSDPNILNASYIPGNNDKVNGIVTLTLTSTGNGLCNAVSDQMIITIIPEPVVNAGADRSVCDNNPSLTLLGTVVNAGGGIWSGGSGTFSPGNTSLNPVYTLSPAEITAGTVTLTLTSTGNGLCNAKSDQMVITVSPRPTVDAGADQVICADSLGVSLSATFTIATGGNWSTSGTGNFFPNNASANATYVPSASDRNSGNVILTFTANSGIGNCLAVSDQMNISITPAPAVNAGADQTVCGNNTLTTLNGTVTVAAGGSWTTSGTGTFANSNALSTSYTPSALDIAAGTVTLTLHTTGNGSCKAVSDQMFLTITPAPSVNAGADQTVCANNANVTLNGTITVSTGAVWTTSGNGVFTPNATTLNAVYAASPADIAGGTVTLTLTTTGNGLCNAVSDQMNITITPAPAVNAGADQTICAAGENAALNGSVSIAAGGMWSTSGSGIFSPAPNILNASYTPSAADTAAHTVTLTLTTTGNGNCLPVSDDLILSIRPVPIVNAGPDTTVCGTVEFVTLSGSVVNAAGLTWSSSGAGFFSPDNSASTVQYLPSGTELSGGTVTITLTSSGSGSCAPVTDQMQITILPIPAANAGPDQTVCANNALVQLNGSVTNAAGGTWISGGDGTFSDENILNPVYTPSSDDISSGSVTLTLFTTGTGVCNPVSDQMTLTFSPAPAVNAGPDQSVCANNPTATLNGTVTIASGAVWTTSGSGIFSPSANTLNATYTPSNADTAAGSVTLTLTSTGNGNCLAETDNMILTISDAPAVNPGSNQTVCANTAGVTLNGSVIVAGGGTWTTASGTGTFLPDANTLNAVFIPSPLQIGNGQAILTLTSNNNGNCNAVSANMVITLQAAPSANAGPDVEVCTGTANIILNGTVSNAAGGSWTTSGSGNFIPSSSALNASYQPDPAENFDGSVITLTLSTTGNGVCPPAADQMTISFETIPVNAGPDQTVCSNSFPVQLNGLGSGSWSGGTGTFSDPNSLSTSYTPALGEVPGVVTLTLTGVAVGNCIPGSDDVQITLLNGPAVNAGADQTICANNPVVSLNGTVNFAGGGTWTTEGSGTFTNANSLNTTYTASAADITAGSVRITLTSTGNGICNPASDTLLISFSPAPLVNAGTDQAACENSGPVTLNGSLTIAPGGIWSIVNGNGSIANPALLNTSYTPDPSDITAGSVTLRLTSNAVGNCNPVTDEMIITFGNAPAANAGPDQTVCGDVLSVNLNGSVINAGGGQWTSNGSGTFTPNAFALSASYVPSAADTSAGSVILTLTTTGNGNCLPVQDQMIITITDVPSANAGADQTLCADVISVSLSGSVSTATGGLWSTSGTGTFSNANSLNTSYTPSAAEKNAGSVLLTLTTTGNGTCNSYSNNVTLFFTPAPTVNAGLDQTGCVDVASYNISAGATVATGIIWTSSGSGVFGNVNAFNTTYTPSAADKLLPSVTLTATTSSGTGTCNPVSDEMIISFTGAPTVNAGSDRNVCADKDSINLSAAFTVASGATWTSSGSGTFTNPSDPNTAYFFSSADKAGSSVTLTLTTNGNGTCNAATDDLVVTIAPFPIVNAGADQTICSGQANATLNGTMLNAVGGIWTSSGTGSFSDANALNTTYFPTQQDFDLGGIILTLTSTGNGNCNAVSDFVVVNVIPSPAAIVNAGMDQSVCADVAEVKLTGFISNAGGGVWSSPGTGTFIPNVNSLEAAYRPSAADKALGSITLTLTTVNNGICSPVTDDMTITFTPAPTVNAGPDLTICGDLAGAANLNGSFTVATGAIWSSSGTGVFVPNEATMAATYIPSASDKNTGTVGLTLTTTGNGTCQSVSDFMLLRITSPPTANAGPDQTVCENVSSVILNGSVTIATGGSWTTSGSGNFTNTNSLVTMYNPSANDINSGAINLTLTTTGNGSCTPVTDQVRITFQTVPVVSAGSNQTICANTSAQLNGTVSGASGVVWTTAGTGVFSSVNALNPIYSPSQQDISAGSVILTLTSTGNGQCPPATDQTRINLQPAPSVNAGLAVSCDPVSGVPLSGSVSNASGGKWSTSGTGVFFPSPASVITAYFPSQPDVSSGSVTLTLTSTGNGVCPETSHSIPLNFQNTPAADAGADEYVCPGSSITLSAQTFPNITYNWTNLSGTSLGTNADLTFNVNTDTTLVLTITDQRGCQSTDTVNINLFTLPGLSLDPAYCLDNSLILIPGQSPLPTVPGTYQWFINGSIITGSNAPVLSPVKPGIYRIVFSYGNCFSDASTNVTGPPELTSEFIMDCEGNATDITITSNVNGVNYTWSTGQSGMDLNTISITVLQDTTYYRATVTDALGCSSRDSVRVIGIPVPLINLSDISSCEGEIEVLAGRPLNIVNLDSLYPDYTWFRNTIQIADKNDSLSINASGQYVLQLVIGQCTVTDTAQADFHVNPAASLPDYAKFCALTDNYIIIDAGGDPGAGDTYLWTAPAGITLDSNNTKTTGIRREGKYYVLVKNIFNCSTTDSIFADDLCPPLLDVPTGFIPGSPGPDGTFRVFGNYFRNFRLLIFNRWGEVIFMSTDKNEGWDGTYRGELMPVGVYPWVVTYEGEDEEYKGPHRKEGSVTLVR